MTIQNKNKTIIIQRLLAYLIVLKYTQLIKIFNTDSVSAECIYDPFGRRVSKTIEREKDFDKHDHDKEHDKDFDKDDDDHNVIKTTYYVYDNENIVMEYNDKGKITAQYTHGLGIDEPLAFTNKHGETYYYHADGLGSIVALTDSKQHVVQTYEYDSFGNMKQQGHKIKQPYTFTGREWDEEIGLYYLRARYFDPLTGRFITKDPSLIWNVSLSIPYLFPNNMEDPRELNLYVYVKNNPLKFKDPFGLSCEADCKDFEWKCKALAFTGGVACNTACTAACIWATGGTATLFCRTACATTCAFGTGTLYAYCNRTYEECTNKCKECKK